jgi:hypothetical protein
MATLDKVNQQIEIVKTVRKLGLTRGTRKRAQAQLERLLLTKKLLEKQDRD